MNKASAFVLALALACASVASGQAESSVSSDRSYKADRARAGKGPLEEEKVQVIELKDTITLEPARTRYVYSKTDPLADDGSYARPRTIKPKRVYFGAAIGYAVPASNATDLWSSGGWTRAKVEGQAPFSFYAGLNGEGPLRIEGSYFMLYDDADIVAAGGAPAAKFGVQGGSLNIYADLGDRTDPETWAAPYIGGGFGGARLRYESAGAADHVDKKTYMLGAGLTVGFNSYIALDIGWRRYWLDPADNNIAAMDFDGLITDIAALGLKFQF
jgi:hypothetical protein